MGEWRDATSEELVGATAIRQPDYQHKYEVNGVSFESDVPLTPEQQQQAHRSITTGARTDVGDFASLRRTSSDTGGWRDATAEEAGTAPSAVKPGDVKGLKNLFAQQDASGYNVPLTRDPTILGELVGGVKQAASGIKAGVSGAEPGTNAPLSAAERALYPVRGAALGAVQAAASPFAPVEALASRAGAGTQDKLLAMGANPTLAAALATGADMATNLGLTAGLGLGKKAIQLGLEKFAPGAASKLAGAEGAVANFLKSGRTKAAEAGAARDASMIAEDAALAAKQSNIASRTESMQSIADASQASLPSKADLQKIGGPALGEKVGSDFVEHYHAARKSVKSAADEMYDAALGPREAGQNATSNLLEDQTRTLQEQIKSASTEAERKMATDAFEEFIKSGEAPESTVRSLHEQLIKTRAEKRTAQRLQNDNAARLLGAKEDRLQALMEEKSPGVGEALSEADRYYATNYSPYFSKGSPTRAIADRDPAGIAKAIVLPNTNKNAVSTIERAQELLGNNTNLKTQVAHAHLNELIDEASKSKDFGSGIVRAWDRFTHPSGDNNKVLRLAYGDEYKDVNSLINQFRTVKGRDLSSVAEAVTKQGVAEGKVLASESAAYKEGIAKNAQAQIEKALGVKKDQTAVEKLVGKEPGARLHNYEAGKFIGPLLITEGAIHSALGNPVLGGAQVLSGIGVMISRSTLGKLMQFKQGRSLIKAALRSVPGSSQAFATSRAIQTLAKNLPNEGNP
jgi:hypothetical protein